MQNVRWIRVWLDEILYTRINRASSSGRFDFSARLCGRQDTHWSGCLGGRSGSNAREAKIVEWRSGAIGHFRKTQRSDARYLSTQVYPLSDQRVSLLKRVPAGRVAECWRGRVTPNRVADFQCRSGGNHTYHLGPIRSLFSQTIQRHEGKYCSHSTSRRSGIKSQA